MNWFLLVNLACVIFSWKVAQGCKEYGTAWWLNMTASALNGVVIVRALF